MSDPSPQIDDQTVQSQAELVSSPDMARKVMEKLGLAGRSEFNSSGVFSFVTALLGGGGSGDPSDRVVEAVQGHVTVFPVAKSRVLQIEFTSADPALAAKGANTLADFFLTAQEDAKKGAAKAAAAWLSSRIDQMRVKVSEADSKLEAFRAQAGLQPGANGMTVPNQRLAEINSQIASARAAQSAAAAKAQLLGNMLRSGRLDAVSDVAGDNSLRKYAEARVALKAQIAEEFAHAVARPSPHEGTGGPARRSRRGDARCGVQGRSRLRGRGASHGRAGEESRARGRGGIPGAGLDGFRSGATAIAGARSQDAARAARILIWPNIAKPPPATSRILEPPNARVIETAIQPRTPVFPKKAPTLLLGTLAGFVLSLSAVVARAILAEDAAGRGDGASGDAAAGGEFESAPLPPRRRGRGEPEPLREPQWRGSKTDDDVAIDDIVDRLAEVAPRGRLTMLVTGEAAPGALAMALAAARRLSQHGRTVLVDLGLTQPWLSDVVDRNGGEDDPFTGLGELADGRATFEQALHRDLSSRLDILPVGSEAIYKGELAPVLEALVESYEHVVVHASDWRSTVARGEMRFFSAILLCARQARLADLRERAIGEIADPLIRVEAVALERLKPIERAA